MARIASWLVVAVVLCGAAFVAATTGDLPLRVATHFGRGGAANGWMTRDGYLAFALAFTVLLPLVVLVVTGFTPRWFPGCFNVPHGAQWLAPPHRERTLAWMQGFAAFMGLATASFAIAVHALILAANASTPPRLDEGLFIGVLVTFVAALLAGIVAMYARFRHVA